MSSNVTRWMKYARARIESAVGKGNQELDRLEAERQADLADRPWLAADGDAPTLDEARARIRWEAEQAAAAKPGADRTAGGAEPPAAPGASEATPPAGASAAHDGPEPSDAPTRPAAEAPRAPEDVQAEAEAAGARLELEARQRESAARLDAIRAELGIEPPPANGPSEPKAH